MEQHRNRYILEIEGITMYRINKSSIKKPLLASGIISCMFILLTNPKSALQGAGDGLILWYRTLFPTLMPFMVLSNLIVLTGCAKSIGRLLMPLTRLLHLPNQAGYCILVGFLCGYPMGAYVCAGLNKTGELNNADAAYLASICNNASPMFMLSYISIGCLGSEIYFPRIILSLAGGAILSMFILRIINKPGSNEQKNAVILKPQSPISVADALNLSIENALTASLKLCIYVMLFSVAGSIISELNFINDIVKAGLVSLCEITAGLHKLAMLNITNNMKFILMMIFTAFGGLSSVFQTMSLSAGAYFNTGKYFAYKLSIALITALFVLFIEAVGI